jgi:hypothetical protein
MFTRVIPAALLVAMIGWAVAAQPPAKSDAKADPKADPRPAAKPDGPMFELRLGDDTQMKVVLLDPSLAMTTKYGKLTIPATEVRRLELGFRFPEGMEARIDKAISDLGSPEFKDREAAEQALAECGHHAIPALRRAGRSDTPEVVRRAASVLKLIEGKVGADKAELRDYDLVETAEFTAKGRIETGVLKVRTKFFGEATVKLTDVRTFRAIGGAAGSGEFALDSALYAKQNLASWLETNVEVSSGTQLEITAAGQIDTWPQQPGQYLVGPAGQGGGGFPGAFPPGGGVPGGAVRIGSPGQVIGRIGANGTPFIVGASYKGKVTESGRLYLRIAPSSWGNDSAGSYKIKVSTE